MVKIIKRGTKKTCTCNECGCVFSYEDEDIETVYIAHNVFGIEANVARDIVKCPQCETEIILNQTK